MYSRSPFLDRVERIEIFEGNDVEAIRDEINAWSRSMLEDDYMFGIKSIDIKTHDTRVFPNMYTFVVLYYEGTDVNNDDPYGCDDYEEDEEDDYEDIKE